MSSLDFDTITQLLAGEAAQAKKSEPDQKYPRPIQVGPLSYVDETQRCANRGCSGPTRIKVAGVPYCSSHALYHLNRMIIAQDSILDDRVKNCDCNAGRHSIGSVHTSDCATYIQISLEEQSGDNSSTNTTSLPGEL